MVGIVGSQFSKQNNDLVCVFDKSAMETLGKASLPVTHEEKKLNLTFINTFTSIASVVIGIESLNLITPDWRNSNFNKDMESKNMSAYDETEITESISSIERKLDTLLERQTSLNEKIRKLYKKVNDQGSTLVSTLSID